MGYSHCFCAGSVPFNISDYQTIKRMSLLRFLVYYSVFMLALAVGPYIFDVYYADKEMLIPKFWSLFTIFGILTFSIYIIAHWRMSISNKASGQVLLGSISVKLFICMVIAYVYLSGNSVEPVKFMLNFFYLYFFHTVFEIYCLLCNLRNQKFK